MYSHFSRSSGNPEECILVAAQCEHKIRFSINSSGSDVAVAMRKNYTALKCLGVCLLLEIYRRCCTSGPVANREVKSMLRASLLRGDRGNARMAGW